MFAILVVAGVSAGHAQVRQAHSVAVVARYRDAAARALGAELEPLLGKALARYSALFGGPAKDSSGKALDSVIVDVASGRVGAGESDAGVIRLTVGARPVFGFYDWRLTLLHEAFHLWSAETFRYAAGKEEWFNEGTAEFYALQAAGAFSVLDPPRVASTAATLAGFYTTSTDLGSLSLREAGTTPQLKADHYFLVYDGGFSAALVLDHDIRAGTGNTKSLDDLMRWLYTHCDRDEHPYSESTLLAGLKETVGVEYDEFFFRFIDGHSMVPVSNLGLGAASRALTGRSDQAGHESPPDPILMASLGLK